MRVSLLAVLLVVASSSALAADKPELRYEGKPLADWVTRFKKADTREQRAAAGEAIVAFGADAAPAVPALIEMLSDLSPTFRYEVMELLGKLGPIAKDARPAILKLRREKKNTLQIHAFIALFPKPKEAIPDLIPFLDDPDDGGYVCSALCEMGPEAKDAIPAIRQYVLKCLAAKEKDKEQSLPNLHRLSELGSEVVPLLVEMLDVHGGHGREDALQCLEKLGPQAIKAAPALLKFLKNDEPATRYLAAVALWRIEKNPAVISALAELLNAEAEFEGVVWKNLAAEAAGTLGEIGPDAKAALPALREAVAIGIPASVLAGVYDQKEYRISLRFRALVGVAEAAEEAINKIEGKAKK